MTKAEYYELAGKLRSSYHKEINDVYIWSTLAINSLDLALADHEFLTTKNFAVPSKYPNKTVSRTKVQVSTIVEKARDIDLSNAVLAFLVAKVEAFLHDILFNSLVFDEKKLKTRVAGADYVQKIDVNEIIDRRTRKELIEVLIEKQLASLFYAKPEAQFEYVEAIVGVELNDATKDKWIEIKATRDLVVHNSSIVNNVYLKKAGSEARGRAGDRLVIDREYMDSSVVTMKALVGSICSHIQRTMKSDA